MCLIKDIDFIGGVVFISFLTLFQIIQCTNCCNIHLFAFDYLE